MRAQLRERLGLAFGNEYVVPFEAAMPGWRRCDAPGDHAFEEMPFATVAIADQGPRLGGRIVQPPDQLRESLGLQSVPEDLRQPAGKAVEAVDEKPGVFDEDRFTDHLEGDQQLVADQLVQVLGTQLLDTDGKGLHLDSAGLENLANLEDLLRVDGREADFHGTSQLGFDG